ncbi:hypothetical protein ACIBAH_33945 [Streptomyces sp. NPDC051445]|uniref:hypothetical protein n=1 Tax=Streptomyces sp. NPDC051445 TaxID=3365653 RepID=UPI0037A3A22A
MLAKPVQPDSTLPKSILPPASWQSPATTLFTTGRRRKLHAPRSPAAEGTNT